MFFSIELKQIFIQEQDNANRNVLCGCGPSVTRTEIVNVPNTTLFQRSSGATRSHTNNSPRFPIFWRNQNPPHIIYRKHTKGETQHQM